MLVHVTQEHPELASAMVAFHYPGKGPYPLPLLTFFDRVWKDVRARDGIEIAIPGLPTADGLKPLVRLSNAWFVTEDELARFARLLNERDWNRV